VKLTSHLHLVPWSRMIGAIPLLPQEFLTELFVILRVCNFHSLGLDCRVNCFDIVNISSIMG